MPVFLKWDEKVHIQFKAGEKAVACNILEMGLLKLV